MKEIFTRRSVRNYNLEKKLTKEELKDIIKAGMSAPSARGQQAWVFMIIDDMNIINKLSEKIVKSTMKLNNANTYIAVFGRKDAPIIDMLPTDLAACQMNMITYARSKDLGTCWIGVYGNKEREEIVSDVLNVDSNYFPFSLLAIGYPSCLNCFKEVSRLDETKIFYNEFK